MFSKKLMLFITTLALLGFVIFVAAGSNANDELTTHTITSNANNDNANPSSDFDGDGIVGFPDFLLFVAQFGSSQGDAGYDPRYDLDGDGTIGFGDFLIFVENFGKEIPSAVVSIPDANLRAAIEEALGKASGATITVDEVGRLTSLDLTLKGIQDPSTLSGLTNLRRLVLYGNQFLSTDWSFLSGLVNLTYLSLDQVYNIYVHRLSDDSQPDLSQLSGLTNLWHLRLCCNNISDLSPLPGLTNLTHLQLSRNNISDLSPLSRLTNLTHLQLSHNNISDLSPLSRLTNLTDLELDGNNISDLSPLSRLTNLTDLELDENNISDLSPLLANTRLARVSATYNPLNPASISTHIPTLRARNVTVTYSEYYVVTEPHIYNDNVFVLPVTEDLTAGPGPLQDYAVRFYEYFSDEFDFLLFLPAQTWSDLAAGTSGGASYRHANNDVQGIGLENFFRPQWGSAGKLQGVVYFKLAEDLSSDLSYLIEGPILHELMHRWANWILPRSDGRFGHWGFQSTNGILGGFDIATLQDHGDGRYSATRSGWDIFSTGGWSSNKILYSPIELYLAGFIPPEEVPDIWVAVDGEYVYNETGYWDSRTFTATQTRIYTIEDIIAEHGPRLPDHSQAQRHFRAATILLTMDAIPVTVRLMELLSRDASRFSYAGEDQFDEWYNFYEATGGRATITMDGLSQFIRSRGSEKKLVPNSYGTPPPPIVDHWERGGGRRRDE